MLAREVEEMSLSMRLKKQVKELQANYPKWIFKLNDGYVYGFGNVMTGVGKEIAMRISLHGIFVMTSSPTKPEDVRVDDCLSLGDLKNTKGEVHTTLLGDAFANGDIYFMDSFFDLRIGDDYGTIAEIHHEIVKPFIQSTSVEGEK